MNVLLCMFLQTMCNNHSDDGQVTEGIVSYAAPDFGYIRLFCSCNADAYFRKQDTVELCENLNVEYRKGTVVSFTVTPQEFHNCNFKARNVSRVSVAYAPVNDLSVETFSLKLESPNASVAQLANDFAENFSNNCKVIQENVNKAEIEALKIILSNKAVVNVLSRECPDQLRILLDWDILD